MGGLLSEQATCYTADMAKYDAIVVLASQPDPGTWEFPAQLHSCMDKAVEVYDSGQAPYIIVSGDHAISFDNRHISQPFRECDKMAEYLETRGVPSDAILREGESRDTISNLYFLKERFFLPQAMTKLVFPVASFRIPRLTFLCDKVLGDDYAVTFEPIQAEQGVTYNEELTMRVQGLFLEPMSAGDHHWLDGKFYDAWMYHYWRERSQEKQR